MSALRCATLIAVKVMPLSAWSIRAHLQGTLELPLQLLYLQLGSNDSRSV